MAKARSVLGKGLSALIPSAPDEVLDEQDVLRADERTLASGESAMHSHPAVKSLDAMTAKIEIAKVAPNPLQPRKDFPAEALAELTESIREHGVIQAITVRRVAASVYDAVESGWYDAPRSK